jgi:hypothetical protein
MATRIQLLVNAAAGKSSVAERKQLVDAEVERLVAAGGTKTRVVDREDQYWIEMEDPEGNWFCVQ